MPTPKMQSCRRLLVFAAAFAFAFPVSSAESLASDTPTAYEMLQTFDFPKGILPQGVRSYTLNGDGTFAVMLDGDCEFKVDGGYLLKYGSKITGKVHSGSLTNLRGISVRVLFAWFSINGVARNEAQLNFFVGPLSASFPISNFEECPRCRCGFDCASSSALSAEA